LRAALAVALAAALIAPAGRNGHTYAFAVMVRGGAIANARRAQDRVARALAAAR
jgi:hypothetical protein